MDHMNLFQEINPKDVVFFNPKISTIQLGVSMTTCAMQVTISKTANSDVRPGQIEKGQKVYNYDNQAYFSMSPEECVDIVRNIAKLMKGEYVNPNSKKDRFPENLKNSITVDHYRENKLSRLVLEQAKRDGRATGALKITIFPPKGGKSEIVNYFFRENEMKIFLEFVKHCAVDLPYHSSVFGGIIKTVKQALWAESNKKKDYNNSNSSNSSNKAYSDKPTNTEPADDADVSTFDDGEASSSESSSGDDSDEFEFGFGS